MRTEVPVLRRCCFCVPLRHGLIVWGYFKLILTLVLLFCVLASLYFITIILTIFHVYIYSDVIIIFSVVLFIVIADVVIHIIFIIGAHKKSVKLLRVYYHYSLILAVLIFLLIIVWFMIKNIFIQMDYGVFIVGDLASLIANIFVQAYIILLVRSEIVKLTNNRCFKFVNNAVEAECTLVIEDPHPEQVTSNIDEDETVDDDSEVSEVTTCNELNGSCC